MVLNNWTRDSWRHGKEIVLATGGGGGIGEAVVRGLSASSAHVVAIDLFPPKKPFRQLPDS
jgi:nucleoside-diphosphate-sugar epimerase